jgi:Fe-S-cluster containining protein
MIVDSERKIGEQAVPIPEQAHPIMRRITGLLRQLERLPAAIPLSASFKRVYTEILGAVECFQNIVVEHSGYTVTCKKHCVDCCNHWVEDVNSFEALLIAEYLEQRQPDRVNTIRTQCESDCRELERLELLVTERLQKQGCTPDNHSIDSVDLLLSVFYQMRRPCPLLTDQGECLVYDVRPITCRMYVSFSDPLRCNPDYINSSLVPTCLIDLSEEANRILDNLHFRYLHYKGDTGLRSLLARHLSE